MKSLEAADRGRRAEAMVTAAGQDFTCHWLPHSMHEYAPGLYASTVINWATALG